MPRVVVTEGAMGGLEHCHRFLIEESQPAARRAGQVIEGQFALLETHPDIGRPFADQPELRKLVISFGDSGYIALYRHEPADDACTCWPSDTRRKRGTDKGHLTGPFERAFRWQRGP